MFRQSYCGPKLPRLNHELEKGLKVIKKHEQTTENRDDVQNIIGNEVMQALVDVGYACYPVLEDEGGFGKYTRIERTVDGRNYFRERWRDRLERYGPQALGGFIAIVGTVIGVVLGAWLSAHPFG